MKKEKSFQIFKFLTAQSPKKQNEIVMHPGKGGCADPVNEDAILERIGGRPPGRNRERQLASDPGGGTT